MAKAPTRKKTSKPADPELRALRALVADAPDLALVGYDASGTIVDFDSGAERLFGHAAADIVGQRNGTLIHGEENVAPFRLLLKQATKNAAPQDADLMARTAGGKSLPVRVIMVRVAGDDDQPARFLALYRSHETGLESGAGLLERLRTSTHYAEREAEFLRELLRHTIDTVRLGLAVQDISSGMIAYTNEGFERLTGFSQIDTQGRTFVELFAGQPEFLSRLTSYITDITGAAGTGAPPPTAAHWEVDLPTGQKSVAVYGRSIAIQGHENQFVLVIIEDTTERERLQMKLVQSEKLAAVGQLAAGIAHEIRNPLNTIYNAIFDLTEIVQHRTPDVEEDISICIEEIRRVQEIINNLLDFARESERSTGSSNLNDVIRKTIRLVRHQLGHRHIRIEWELGEIPDVAMHNNALKQILINLVTNAAQAMPEGGRLTVRTFRMAGMVPLGPDEPHAESARRTAVRLGPGQGGASPTMAAYSEHVVLEIEDTGSGIPPQILRSIFNPFFTTKAPGSGTGLGLSVVHSLVRDAGGAIGVTSEPGVGTTFRIELPGWAEPVD